MWRKDVPRWKAETPAEWISRPRATRRPRLRHPRRSRRPPDLPSRPRRDEGRARRVSDTSALYEPLIERELAAIPAAARAFAAEHSADDLWIAVTRFAVLAYAPSQHAKRAVMACRAAHDLRDALGDRWLDMIIECARYAAESRQPW